MNKQNAIKVIKKLSKVDWSEYDGLHWALELFKDNDISSTLTAFCRNGVYIVQIYLNYITYDYDDVSHVFVKMKGEAEGNSLSDATLMAAAKAYSKYLKAEEIETPALEVGINNVIKILQVAKDE